MPFNVWGACSSALIAASRLQLHTCLETVASSYISFSYHGWLKTCASLAKTLALQRSIQGAQTGIVMKVPSLVMRESSSQRSTHGNTYTLESQ